MASRATVEQAITAAEAAFPVWRRTPPLKQARILFAYKALLDKHAERIVAAIVEEHGKVWEDAQGELQRGIEVVEHACGAPEFLKGEHSREVGPEIDSLSEFPPLGVVAASPRSTSRRWSRCGCFRWRRLRQLLHPQALREGSLGVDDPRRAALTEAGLPPGVFNVVNGDKARSTPCSPMRGSRR